MYDSSTQYSSFYHVSVGHWAHNGYDMWIIHQLLLSKQGCDLKFVDNSNSLILLSWGQEYNHMIHMK